MKVVTSKIPVKLEEQGFLFVRARGTCVFLAVKYLSNDTFISFHFFIVFYTFSSSPNVSI